MKAGLKPMKEQFKTQETKKICFLNKSEFFPPYLRLSKTIKILTKYRFATVGMVTAILVITTTRWHSISM